jgi:hypothetical protein
MKAATGRSSPSVSVVAAVSTAREDCTLNSLINDPGLAAIYEENLLVSESQWRYTAFKNATLEQLKPRDLIEHMWAAEIIQGEWETLRLRRFKSQIVTSARRPALQNLLHLLLQNNASEDIDDLAERFFSNKEVRRKVGAILRNFGLTEANIDAEAFRQSLSELAEINRRLAELGSRRDRILQRMEDHRAGLATPPHVDQGEGNDRELRHQNGRD